MNVLEEAKKALKTFFNEEMEKRLEDYPTYSNYESYGDTLVCSGSYYRDEDVDNCCEDLKEELLAELKEDSISFQEKYLEDVDADFEEGVLEGIINSI